MKKPKQLVLRAYTIDQAGYDVNYRQIKPTADTNTIYGYANKTRSRLVFNNINLQSIFGSEYSKRNEFTIKLKDVKMINSRTDNLITYGDASSLRTSNLVMKGLNTLNTQKDIILCQATNYNPNEERTFNCILHRGNNNDYIHVFGPQTYENWNFYQSLHQYTDGNNIQKCRYLFVGEMIPELHNKVITPVSCAYGGGVTFNVAVLNDGTFPARIAGDPLNQPCTMTFIPSTNEWYFMRVDHTIPEDEHFGVEVTFLKPSTNLNLEFELRYILTDALQPVATTNKVYPSIELVFDIY